MPALGWASPNPVIGRFSACQGDLDRAKIPWYKKEQMHVHCGLQHMCPIGHQAPEKHRTWFYKSCELIASMNQSHYVYAAISDTVRM